MKTIQLTLTPQKTDYNVNADPGDSLCVCLPPGASWGPDPSLGIPANSTAPFCQTGIVPGAFNLIWSIDGRSTNYAIVYIGSANPNFYNLTSSSYSPSLWDRIAAFFRKFV